RDVDLHAPNRRTTEALDDVQVFRAGQAAHVEPGFAVLADGVHDERVAVPLASRITLPGGLRILGQRPAVGKNLPEDRPRMVEEDEAIWRLDDLQAVRNAVFLGNA